MKRVVISDTPHLRNKVSTRGIMLDVLIALLPATVVGCVYFGWRAVVTLVLSVAGAVLTEFVWLLCKRVNIKAIIKQFDLTSVVTGFLLGLTMPAFEYSSWYVPLICSVFAIAVVKMLFGGTGKNIVNPAIAGRVFGFIAFSSVMVSGWIAPSVGILDDSVLAGATSITSGATPLTNMLADKHMGVGNLDLLLGTGVMGCIGETCKVALIAGGIYLVIRKVIKWQWPVIYIAVTGLVSVAMEGSFYAFLPSILSGGLMLGAIFMATDYVTSPNNKWACYVYYVVLGVITALLRYGTGIEVVSFAILLMNLIVPLLNTYIRPRPFGSTPIVELVKEKLAKLKKNKGEEVK